MNYRYSVVIPAFNAEATLRRCLDSLLNQNRRDVQIILVSDGSTDGTDAIARGYGDRICFLRQEHTGVSAARNRGMAAARGRYLTFVDSDDWVSADYFAALDREPDCDLLLFGLEKALRRRCRGADSGELLLRSGKLTSCCSKRISREFLEASGIRFPEGLQVGEDFLFSFLLIQAAGTVRLSGACVYHVDVSNQNSLSRGYRPHLAEDLDRVFSMAAESGVYPETLDYLYARSVLTCLAEGWKAEKPDPEQIHRICDRFRREIGPGRGLIHGSLRLALSRRWDWLLFWIAYVGKGRKFRWNQKRY